MGQLDKLGVFRKCNVEAKRGSWYYTSMGKVTSWIETQTLVRGGV
jgi:hypothetical protein